MCCDGALEPSGPLVGMRQLVEEAQRQWGNGLVSIGRVYKEGGDYRKLAREFVQTMYGFDYSTVLFKPTRASLVEFRTDVDGALSYFIGENDQYSEDRGFALQPWSKIRFENIGMILKGSIIAMGDYFFTDYDGNEVMVDFTFAYLPDEFGRLRIVAHHSSLPYHPSEDE